MIRTMEFNDRLKKKKIYHGCRVWTQNNVGIVNSILYSKCMNAKDVKHKGEFIEYAQFGSVKNQYDIAFF